jgi:hypothetical protein
VKKIAVGDLGEFWYGDYKEPFEQLEGGVPGHPVGVVLKADDGKVLCAYCGKTYDFLGGHVRQTHGMTVSEYKAEVGLLQKSALVSERVRVTRIRIGKKGMVPFQRGNPQNAHAQVSRRDGRMKRAHWVPERLNKTGRCYEQVLHTARAIANEGHTVTQHRLSHRGIGAETVRVYFGSVNELRGLIGERRTPRGKWTEREVIAGLRNLAFELGRTPAQSDMRRFGLPYGWIRDHLGGMAEAARRAGLDPNLPIPDSTDLDSRVLVSYATLGNVIHVGKMLHIDPSRVSAVLARYGCPYPAIRGAMHLRREWAADMARRLAGTGIAA